MLQVIGEENISETNLNFYCNMGHSASETAGENTEAEMRFLGAVASYGYMRIDHDTDSLNFYKVTSLPTLLYGSQGIRSKADKIIFLSAAAANISYQRISVL
jgi:hypothetical protein